jgi:hypothetical protein
MDILQIRTFNGPDPEVEVTKKQNPLYTLSYKFSIDISILGLAYEFFPEVPDFFLLIPNIYFLTKVSDFSVLRIRIRSFGPSGPLVRSSDPDMALARAPDPSIITQK